MNSNFLATFDALGLTAEHAFQLARNSFEASFCSDAQRAVYMERLAALQ
jgi:adenine deaminase